MVYEAVDNRLKRSLVGHLRYASHYWLFFLYWVRRGIITRYSQTSVGLLWAVFQPLLSSLVYIIVFSFVVRVSTEPVPYPLFVVTSLVFWTYLNRVIFSGAASIVTNLDLITRVQFPREFLPLGVLLEAVIDLLLGLAIVAVLLLIYQHPVTPYLLIVPWIFLAHTFLALGLAFFLAGMASVIRDLFQVLPILLQLLLYLSPVIYPLNIVPESIRVLYSVNPLAPIFAAYQETILFGRFTLVNEMIVVTIIAVVTLVSGYLFFKRMEWRFADAL
jgi:ABC-type polysaccharide/polyol phosphate export permease